MASEMTKAACFASWSTTALPLVIHELSLVCCTYCIMAARAFGVIIAINNFTTWSQCCMLHRTNDTHTPHMLYLCTRSHSSCLQQVHTHESEPLILLTVQSAVVDIFEPEQLYPAKTNTETGRHIIHQFTNTGAVLYMGHSALHFTGAINKLTNTSVNKYLHLCLVFNRI